MRVEIEEIKNEAGEVVRRRVRHFPVGESATKQAMKDECDINSIMQRYERTGVIAHVAKRDAYFADVSVVPDFAQALQVVRDAEEMFASLPARIRKEFDNDAAAYVRFCTDPANVDRMRELGLAEPLPQPIVQKVEVVNPQPGGVA